MNRVSLSLFSIFPAILPFLTWAESHPNRVKLRCDRAAGSTLRAQLWDISLSPQVKIAEYGRSPMGICELAVRLARDHTVCIERTYNSYELIDISSRDTLQRFGSDVESCLRASHNREPLRSEAGFMEFIPESERKALLKNLPQTQDETINAVLSDPKTMWYDETSMAFVYQDSFGDPKGLRANRVGFDVGHTSDVPDIMKLTQYFEHGRFRFPFGIAAGVDFMKNEHVFYFWHAPRVGDQVLPVAYWNNKTHVHWSFPEGTIFGEVMSLRAPDDGEWYIFEIRTRARVNGRWVTGIYRPFIRAEQMVQAIEEQNLSSLSLDLQNLLSHLKNPQSLKPRTLGTGTYKKIIDDFQGAADILPAIMDYGLIKGFLRNRIYQNAMGSTWKRDQNLVTFAASTDAEFHIVPKGYIGGMFENTERSCARCHNQTGRPLGHLDDRIVLYGEIWGEEEIFTWHPFAIGYDSFGVSDNNRRINPKMQSSGLVRNFKPGPSDRFYKIMKMPFDAVYEVLSSSGNYADY